MSPHHILSLLFWALLVLYFIACLKPYAISYDNIPNSPISTTDTSGLHKFHSEIIYHQNAYFVLPIWKEIMPINC